MVSRPKNLCAFCDCSKKSNRKKKGNLNTKSREENIKTRAFAYHGGIPRSFHHVSFAVNMRKCQKIKQGWRSIPLAEKPESISTEVHFHCLN